MFSFFKKRSKTFKWSDNPEGRLLEQKYWNEDRIGYKPVFPIVCIDFNDGGTIGSFKSFGDIEQKWNHMLFENHIEEEYPTYFIDSNLTISILKYHPEKFNYPVPEESIGQDRFIQLVKRCGIKNMDEFESLSSTEEILSKLINEEIQYEANYPTIETEFEGELPKAYLDFLRENPEGTGINFNEYKDENPDFEGRYWNLMGEETLLESWVMNGVGEAKNFESLKLYIQVQKDFTSCNWTTSNVGKINLDRIERGFVFGDENGDYLYLDPSDSYSVWVYFHDGGDVLRIADSFVEFIGR